DLVQPPPRRAPGRGAGPTAGPDQRRAAERARAPGAGAHLTGHDERGDRRRARHHPAHRQEPPGEHLPEDRRPLARRGRRVGARAGHHDLTTARSGTNESTKPAASSAVAAQSAASTPPSTSPARPLATGPSAWPVANVAVERPMARAHSPGGRRSRNSAVRAVMTPRQLTPNTRAETTGAAARRGASELRVSASITSRRLTAPPHPSMTRPHARPVSAAPTPNTTQNGASGTSTPLVTNVM